MCSAFPIVKINKIKLEPLKLILMTIILINPKEILYIYLTKDIVVTTDMLT